MAALHATVGTLVPLILVSAMTRFFGPSRSVADGLQVWKFALFAAISMTVPYMAAAYFLGPEFPALLGSVAGLFIVVSAARRGFLMPPRNSRARASCRARAASLSLRAKATASSCWKVVPGVR